NTDAVEASLYERMMRASEEERFEEAARCRDALSSLKKLGQTQKTQLSPDTDCDVIAFASHEGCDCAAVLYIRGGKICDSEYFTFGADEITGVRDTAGDGESGIGDGVGDSDGNSEEETPMSAFIVELYRGREYIPPEILLSFEMSEGERTLIGEYLGGRSGRKVVLRTPKKGEGRSLCLMAQRDAVRHSEARRRRDEDDERVLVRLASLLSLEVVPERIEAYDISNLGSEHITAGMVVAEGGKMKKSDYRYFRIKGQNAPDDYEAMRQALLRRLSHLDDSADASFSKQPDLILLDGGAGHVSVVRDLMREAGYDIPVFGMVKDDHHKTRTIVSDTQEVSIAREAEVFRFVYKLQEEVHRFTVSRMTAAKRKTLKTSSLEKIKGIGPAKAKKLMAHFKTLSAVKAASLEELCGVTGIGKNDAQTLYGYFHPQKDSVSAEKTQE
ncbi:MAG: helix-hairpin-helix domain-containing protein, partial [Candidatus Avispirillum sp.]